MAVAAVAPDASGTRWNATFAGATAHLHVGEGDGKGT